MRIALLLAVALVACSDEPPAPAAEAQPQATSEPSGTAEAEISATSSAPASSTPSRSVDFVTLEIEATVSHADGPSDLTLRAEPSTQSEALGVMPHDADVFVEACQDLGYDDAWCRLGYDDGSEASAVGYAKRRHLVYQSGNGATDDEGVRWTPEPMSGWADDVAYDFDGAVWDVQADDGYVNVRSGPSADREAVGRITNGSDVSVGECTAAEPGRRWCKVQSLSLNEPQVSGHVHQSGFHRFHRGL